MILYQYLNKKSLNPKLVGIILGILIIGIGYLVNQEFLLLKKEADRLLSQMAIAERTAKQIAQEKVIYTINFDQGEIRSYLIIPPENSTVFSLLEELSKKENFKLEWKIYEGMGVFVESIDGLKNGRDNKYWQYWVNGELPMVAADKKEIKRSDEVEWKFAPSPF